MTDVLDKTTSLRARHSDETRTALIAAARRLFAERGYHNVGIREFAAEAGVTRGALYHHFPDKEAIFLAVYDAVQRDLMREAALRHSASSRPDRWTQLRHDLQIALDLSLDKEFQQIKLVDGPAVIGWVRWREVELQYGLGAILKAVERSMHEGLIAATAAYPLALMISASFNEAALLIVHSKQPDVTRREAGAALDGLLKSLSLDKGPAGA